MENTKSQAYVASLGQMIRNSHLALRESMDQFQELCSKVTPERTVPAGMISDIRSTYKEIQDELTKIRGIHQLLEGKYRLYFRRDVYRNREIAEFTLLAKNLYAKFEYTLREMEAKRRETDRGEDVLVHRLQPPSLWFHSEENEILLLRNLRGLNELDHKHWVDLEPGERRRVIWDGSRSVSLFTFSGQATLIDTLESGMELRPYDIKERLSGEELRGALTHLKEVSPSEVETILKRFRKSGDFSKLRCRTLTIRSKQDLEREISGFAGYGSRQP